MSSIGENLKSETLNVEDILASFFLEKIEMKGSRSESDNKYKKKSKHKKHKSKKYKHKSGRRSDSSDKRSSSSLRIDSSEEKDIKRLKKIKKLDAKNPITINSFLPLPVSLSTQNDHPSNEEVVQNSTSVSDKVDIPYGPSLELLLSGTEIDKGSVSSSNQIEESSSHQSISKSTSIQSDAILPNEPKESEVEKLIIIVNDRVESKDGEALNDVEMSRDKSIHASKQFKGLSELKESDVVSDTVKPESSDIKPAEKSRSRSRSKPRKRSRSKSHTPQSRSRKRSRSNNRSSKKRSHSRDHAKSRHSPQSKTRRSKSRNTAKKSRRSRSRSVQTRRRSRSWSYSRDRVKSKHISNQRSRSIDRRHRSRSRGRDHRSNRSRSGGRDHGSHQSRSGGRDHVSHRSRSHGRDHASHRSRSRGRDNGSHRSRSCGRDHGSHRSRSRGRDNGSHRSQRESSYTNRSNRKSSNERESKSKQRSRSKSKEKYSTTKGCKIDQAKIREIAEKNVLNMIQQGTLPEGISIEQFKKKELVSIKAGGKSVQELTDFCAKLSKKENEVNDDTPDKNDVSNLEGENDFIHHPFKLKEQSVIKLNIKNAVQIPVKTHAEKFAETAKLSSQFPVSSGNEHKHKELEWIPVVPEESKKDPKANEVKTIVPLETGTSVAKRVAPKTSESATAIISSDIPSIPLPSAPIQPLPPPPPPPLPPSLPPLPTPPAPPFQLLSSNQASAVSVPCTTVQCVSYPTLPLQSTLPVATSHAALTEASRPYFTNQTVSASSSQIDFASVFSKKFQAEQRLHGDPNNAEALKAKQEAEAALQDWVNSCRVPGMFYGSTHVKPLPREQLGGPKDYRVKKDTFTRAAPVTEGKGMSLLKKMGWNPGEGLGKNKEGALVPLILDIKMDKKGLVSEGESGKNNIANAVKELQGKHPVSALMELCSKRKWKPPLYAVIKDAGPPHKKQFLFKVEVNGVDYQPVIPSSNKKIAKADAAIVCLQALKVFPA